MVQWLRLCDFNAGDVGLVLRVPHATRYGQNKTRAGHEDSAMRQSESCVILNQVARGGVSEEVIVEQYLNEAKEQGTSSRGKA